jgi:hypothetical protein
VVLRLRRWAISDISGTTIHHRQNPLKLNTWRLFKNKILRRTFVLKEENNKMKNYIRRNFMGNVLGQCHGSGG